MGGLSGASRPASGRPAKSIVKGSRVGRGAALKGPLLRPPAALDRCSVPGSDTCPRTRHFGATQCCRSGADKNGRVNPDVADVRLALIRQWELIAGVIKSLDLSAASRCTGWTNREVLAHLYVQPHLVARFIDTESTGETALGIVENLSGTNSFGELIDASARDGAALNKVDLNRPLNIVRARPCCRPRCHHFDVAGLNIRFGLPRHTVCRGRRPWRRPQSLCSPRSRRTGNCVSGTSGHLVRLST